jgi:hypothetical protein
MVLYRSVNALTLATILFFSPVLANARPHHYTYHRHYGYGYGERGGSRPKLDRMFRSDNDTLAWCRLDSSPRDPVYFKKADNRCGDGAEE